MCTYSTERIPVQGSAKGAQGWFSPTTASVYYDHPVHAQAAHSLNIDFLAPEAGPGARVALELTAQTARSLVAAIEAALASVPVELLE
jgi:hypothetical protein